MYSLNTDRVVPGNTTLTSDIPAIQSLFDLFEHENTSSIAFQSVLVAAIQIMERVREEELAVSNAAISLAQRQQLAHMLEAVDSMIRSLRCALNDQGSRILDLQPRTAGLDEQHNSWWFCLAKALETLNAGSDWISSIVSGQHKESPSRKLARIVAHFLEMHHIRLYAETQC